MKIKPLTTYFEIQYELFGKVHFAAKCKIKFFFFLDNFIPLSVSTAISLIPHGTMISLA